MIRHVWRLLGLAAFVAAARAAWLHHLDNQAVIRTDLMRECFAAGQAAERTRAAEEADTARRASYLPGAGQPWSAGWSTTYSPGPPPTLTVLPPGMEEPDTGKRIFPFDLEWPEDSWGTSR